MSRRRHKTSISPVGTSPGTLTYVGAEINHATHIQRIEYNVTDYKVDDSGKLSACQLPDSDAPHVLWLDIDGIHEANVVAALGRQFRLHPLLLEDVMNTDQKPKVEFYDDDRANSPLSGNPVIYVTMKMLHHDPRQHEVDAEHISFVLGSTFLLSFQEERTTDIFAPVLERIKASAGKTRRNGPDYLLYSLMDLVVDNYFVVLENLGEKLDGVEDRIVQELAGRETLSLLYALKREITLMRRYVSPLREMISMLLREESALIQEHTDPFLRDLADHVNQIIDTLDTYRELIPGLLDVYLSSTSNRMNSVMKTLTVMSSIFLPLTFIAGIYGMNFDNMPELHTRTGYFWALGVMGAIFVGMIVYFRRQKWI